MSKNKFAKSRFIKNVSSSSFSNRSQEQTEINVNVSNIDNFEQRKISFLQFEEEKETLNGKPNFSLSKIEEDSLEISKLYQQSYSAALTQQNKGKMEARIKLQEPDSEI